MSTLRNLIIANQSNPPVEEWVEIERVFLDGNTYVDTGFKLLADNLITTKWNIPNYTYATAYKYLCGALDDTVAGAQRTYTLHISGLSGSKRIASFRGGSACYANLETTTYTPNTPTVFTRIQRTFKAYQMVDGVETEVFSHTSGSGSSVTSNLRCFIGAANFNGTPTAGYSTTSKSLYFYYLKQTDTDESTTFLNVVPVKNESLGIIALKNKVTNTILMPQKIDPELDFGGVLYETPPPSAMMLMMGRGFEESEEFDEEPNNEEEE